MAAPKINISKAQICFRNLAGKPTKFNSKGGVRDFAIILDNYDDVESLINMGFPVKYFNKKEPTAPDVPYLKVKVNFRYSDDGTELLSPHIYLVERDPNNPEKIVNKKLVTPQLAAIADQAELDYCDIVIRPYGWEVNGNSGVAAYLDKMFMNLHIDEFESQYEMYDDPDENNIEEVPFE